MEHDTSLGDSTKDNTLSTSPNGQVLPSLSSSSEGASEESSKDGTSEESGEGKLLKDGGRKKPRSEASVFHDKERGVCSCKHCGWIYPNPRPSAKLRREHRKHCSRFKSVHAWLELDPAEQTRQQGGAMDGTLDSVISRKVDEVPTDDNDQLGNVENVPMMIGGENSTGKHQEPEQEMNSSPEPVSSSLPSTLCEQNVAPSPSTSPIEVGSPSARDASTSEQTSPPTQALSSSPEGEVVEERKLPSEIDPSSSSEFDLEKILKEQTSHHLMCPNCGSCITRRVILKKRKRTVSRVSQPQEKVPKLEEPKQEERVVAVETERGVETPIEVPGGDETEAWGCLACFSIFFHKVREQLQEPLERAQNFSCLPYLLPDFHWDGEGYTASDELPERERSTCFPIEFPWRRETAQQTAEEHDTREVEIVIDLTKPRKPIILPDVDWKVHDQRDRGCVLPAKDEEPDSSCIPLKFPSFQTGGEAAHGEEVQERRDRLDCLPVLLPKYWGLDEGSSEVAEVGTETDKTTAGFNCLPALLPAYSWSSSSTTPTQKGTRDISQPSSDESSKVSVDVVDTEEQGQVGEVITDVIDDVSQLLTPSLPSAEQETTTTTPSLPSKVEGPQEEETTRVPGEEDRATSICVPLSLPNWTSQTAGLNCLQTVLPSFSWDGDGTAGQEATTEDDSVCLPITFPRSSWRWKEASEEDKRYVTRETRVQAWINTITNVVTVKSTGEKREDKPTQETSFLDMTVTEQTEGAEKQTKTETLVTTPSTGWALLDALDKDTEPEQTLKLETPVEMEEADEEDVKLVDKRKKRPGKQQTEIEEVQPVRVKTEKTPGIQDILSEFHKHKQADDLKQPLVTSQEELDVEELLSKLPGEYEPPPPSWGPVSATVSVKSSDSLIEVTGGDPKKAVETALAIAEVVTGGIVQDPVPFEYVKSIVYGGLDVTLTSLAVVSSGAGSGTKTINVLAISLANLIAGLITLLHSIGSMYQSDRPSFEEHVGKSLWINGTISVISFLVFGCIAPLTYGLSFRSADDRDYKFAVTTMVSLACIGLMGLGKAYVRKRSYGATIVNLVLTGFVASVAGYFVGDYVKRWLKKLGYDDEPPVSPAPPALSPPVSVSLKTHGLELGRRGRELSL